MKYAGVASIIALSFLPQLVAAQLSITEIMYDTSGSDSGREWIEVYNGTSDPIDLTKYKIVENGKNHKIVGAGTLAPNAYAVIAATPMKFRADWPAFAGLVYDSSFNLGNDGDTIALRFATSTEIATAQYVSSLGAGGDGNSLQRVPGSSAFSPHTPSPGASFSSAVIAAKEKLASVKAPTRARAKSSKHARRGRAFSRSTGADTEADTNDTFDSATSTSAQNVSASAAATAPQGTEMRWLWGALGIGALAAGGMATARRYGRSEWDIVEETDDAV